ncbi:MAG: beta-galactosidase trimerization domain-containing protein [Candidatus Latescibacterota bacterium]
MNSPTERNKPGDWIRHSMRELLVANHMPLAWENVWSKFDAESTAQMFADAGVEKVCYVAKDAYGFSYYPTKYGFVHPHLKRDEVGEFTAALKRRKIRCIPYFYPGVDRVWPKKQPEWKNSDPKAISTDEYATMCFNSPYLEEVALPQIRELASLYDIDGVFLDIVVHPYMIWNCTCRYCREKYAREVGGEIPKDAKDPSAFVYRKWLNSSMEALFRRFHDDLSSVRGNALIEYNLAWGFAHPVNPPEFVPFITMDTPTPDVGLYSWNFSQEARYLSTLHDVVWSCMNTRMSSWGDFTLREEESLMEECAIMLAGGGKTYLADLPYPTGRFDPAVYEVIGAVNRRTQSLEPFLKGCRPVADTCVLHSADTVWSKATLSPFSEWRGGPSYYPVCGAHKALIEGHVQFGIINSQMLPETIPSYGTIILPDQRILSEPETEAIRNFVRAGGAVVATNETGTHGSDNKRLSDFSLADVFGVRYRETVDTSCCYLRAVPELRRFGIPAMDIQVNGPFTLVEPTTAVTILKLIPPYDDIHTGTAPPALPAAGPGVTLNKYGKGTALYFAPELFGSYFREDTPVLRKLILWALDTVYPAEKRKIVLENAPINVEVFFNERSGEKFLHFINYSGDKRDTGVPRVQDMPEVYGMKVKVRLEKRPKSLTLVPEGKGVKFSFADGWMIFETLPLKIHDVYRIEL